MHNNIEGIDQVTLAVKNLGESNRFLADLGLLKYESGWKTLNHTVVELAESDSDTIQQIIFGLTDSTVTTAAVDPNGIEITLRPSQKIKISIDAVETNGWKSINRINQSVPLYTKAAPVEIGHVVIATPKFNETEQFYKDLGFVESDRLIGRGVFLRCQKESGHHDIFLMKSENFRLDHLAFTTRDIYELFAGGLYMDKKNWTTEIGPGRHPISSSFFWYINSPLGCMIEYTCNEDYLTEDWQPRNFEYSSDMAIEWAVAGGIDFQTRRQKTQ